VTIEEKRVERGVLARSGSYVSTVVLTVKYSRSQDVFGDLALGMYTNTFITVRYRYSR
jgi:hypothetical protein